jgi:hypothetical protein
MLHLQVIVLVVNYIDNGMVIVYYHYSVVTMMRGDSISSMEDDDCGVACDDDDDDDDEAAVVAEMILMRMPLVGVKGCDQHASVSCCTHRRKCPVLVAGGGACGGLSSKL